MENKIKNSDLKQGMIVKTDVGHIIKLTTINEAWKEKFSYPTEIDYWNFEIVKKSNSVYMGEVICADNIKEQIGD